MPKNKKEESSSSSDDSSSEEVQKQPVKGKGTPAKKDDKKPVKKQESSDEDSSSSSSSDVKSKKATPAKKEEPKKAAPKKKVESSSDDSDSDSDSSSEEKKPVKKGVSKKAAAKKAESSSDDSDSSSEEAPKKAVKKEEPKKAAPKKKVESSSDDSDSDSSSEEAPKKSAKKQEPKKAAKKDSSDSDSDSDSDDADEESEEKPAPKNDKKRKASDDDEVAKPAAKKAKTESGAVTTATEQNDGSAPETNRLFIGNLSFKIDDDTIRDFFKDVGELTDIHWVTDKQTGKFYGTGFVAFATAEEAKKAVAKNGESLLDRPIKIDFAQSRGERTPKKGGFEKKSFDRPQREPRAPTPKPEGCTTVFLGNLSFQIDENAVRTHFADCGEITAIRWVERDGQFKGCGFVEFADTEATDKAVALNGSDLMGRPLRVDYSAPKPKRF